MAGRDNRMRSIDPTRPDPATIAEAAAIIRSGGLVALPTETVYGLGADALRPAAVAEIFAVKRRPARNPVIVHVASQEQGQELTTDWPAFAALLASAFWPGPLTLVLPRGPQIPDVVTAGGPTVALRWPAHPVAEALIRAAGTPIAAPSANRSTELSPTTAAHVHRSLGADVDLILDAGPTLGGLESTVIDLSSPSPRLLRPGLLAISDIERVIGPVERQVTPARIDEVLPAPGMLSRHYAPRTPLECFETGDEAELRLGSLVAQAQRVAWVGFDPPNAPLSPKVTVRLPRDVAGYSAQLYATLHRLDELLLDRILLVLPPDSEDWLAVRDRLRRASTA